VGERARGCWPASASVLSASHVDGSCRRGSDGRSRRWRSDVRHDGNRVGRRRWHDGECRRSAAAARAMPSAGPSPLPRLRDASERQVVADRQRSGPMDPLRPSANRARSAYRSSRIRSSRNRDAFSGDVAIRSDEGYSLLEARSAARRDSPSISTCRSHPFSGSANGLRHSG
jgi:hypothetical protein